MAKKSTVDLKSIGRCSRRWGRRLSTTSISAAGIGDRGNVVSPMRRDVLFLYMRIPNVAARVEEEKGMNRSTKLFHFLARSPKLVDRDWRGLVMDGR